MPSLVLRFTPFDFVPRFKFPLSALLLQVESVLPEILQLGEYRLASQQREIDSLKGSLKAADERILSQNEQILGLNSEVSGNGLREKEGG